MRGTYPTMPVVGVGALVLRDNEVLLVKRAAPPDRGKWALPGGKVELGEGVCEAARRELQEETRLLCQPHGVVNVDQIITRDPTGAVKYHYVLITVLMGSCEGEPRPASDASEAAFLDIGAQVSSPETAESTRRFLAKVVKQEVPLTRPIRVETSSPPD
ncbi:MAG: NUDIX hydrolase [Acidilobus sp.]